MHLQSGSLLQGGKYRIEKVLGQGGFGITYLAEQTKLGRRVALKEFYMDKFCERQKGSTQVSMGTSGSKDTVNRFRTKFLKEARNIASMDHPNIVRVIDVFEENNTAYYVMEYAVGGSLSQKVKSMGYLPIPLATRYIKQIASALRYIHSRKMAHLDVKPANIMLNAYDDAILIDFGLSKQYDTNSGGQISSTPIGISEGYAPLEQYVIGGVSTFSPETDIYALGATFYYLLTGSVPPMANIVSDEGLPIQPLKAKGVSQGIIDCVVKAMNPHRKERLNNAQAFIDALETSDTETSEEETIPVEIRPEEATISIGVKPGNNPQPANPQSARKNEKDKPASNNAQKSAGINTPKKGKGCLKWIIILFIITAIAAFGFIYYSSSYVGETEPYEEEATEVVDTTTIQITSVKGVEFKMVLVEGGEFTMGTHPNQSDELNNAPQHKVTLSSFLIGQTEVTQQLWNAVMGENPSEHQGYDNPVENVSWEQCQEFISQLNSLQSDYIFRLPTEAEWEYAARGGNKSEFYKYSGSNDAFSVAIYGDNCVNDNDEITTFPVATRGANELGIYDMSGNVWEWCQDWYGDYSTNPQTDPQGPSSGKERVLRGGCFMNDESMTTTSYRNSHDPKSGTYAIGLRLACSY